jgi:hypothetical protein
MEWFIPNMSNMHVWVVGKDGVSPDLKFSTFYITKPC